LRGKDLNLRPLGYEFDLGFIWFPAVPCISMTYFILLALGSSGFGQLFLGSGSAFGSTFSRRRFSSACAPDTRFGRGQRFSEFRSPCRPELSLDGYGSGQKQAPEAGGTARERDSAI
jgi:hypothetical protein